MTCEPGRVSRLTECRVAPSSHTGDADPGLPGNNPTCLCHSGWRRACPLCWDTQGGVGPRGPPAPKSPKPWDMDVYPRCLQACLGALEPHLSDGMAKPGAAGLREAEEPPCPWVTSLGMLQEQLPDTNIPLQPHPRALPRGWRRMLSSRRAGQARRAPLSCVTPTEAPVTHLSQTFARLGPGGTHTFNSPSSGGHILQG